MSQTTSDAAPAAPTGGWKETVEIIKTVISALLIALVLRTVIFQPYTIPSASMEPNLYQGDYIVVSKFSYGWSHHSIIFSPPLFKGRIFEHAPQRGDIVVFKLPRDGHTDYIKRLVGLPGDRIQMREGLLYINDQLVPRQSKGVVNEDTGFGGMRAVQRFQETFPNGKSFMTNDWGRDMPLDTTEVFVVPENYYFFMGDNRDNSSDSRVPPYEDGVGFVPAENLVGKAQFILLSWNKNVSIFKPWTWFLDARPSRFFHALK